MWRRHKKERKKKTKQEEEEKTLGCDEWMMEKRRRKTLACRRILVPGVKPLQSVCSECVCVCVKEAV